jgi:hypothetical protein
LKRIKNGFVIDKKMSKKIGVTKRNLVHFLDIASKEVAGKMIYEEETGNQSASQTDDDLPFLNLKE